MAMTARCLYRCREPGTVQQKSRLCCFAVRPNLCVAFSDSFGLAIVYKHTDVVEVALLN